MPWGSGFQLWSSPQAHALRSSPDMDRAQSSGPVTQGGQGVLVAGTEPPDVVELWDWMLEPGERHDSEAHSDGTRELLHVQEGTVTIEIGGERYDLTHGDALSFHGDAPHAYINSTDASTRFSLTVFEPGVGTAQRMETPNA